MKPVIIITGPTASGKTAFSDMLIAASDNKAEVINADMGQFYKPLTIGTAKPADWQNLPFKCHLFDILEQPTNLNISIFCQHVSSLVEEITKRGNTPIIVGGTLFYIRSLFFPPMSLSQQSEDMQPEINFDQDTATLWHILNVIDQDRAQAIHANDRYRIIRALTIWQKTGRKPSLFQPQLQMPFKNKTIIVDISPQPKVLQERITVRTKQMLTLGWIEEVQTLLGTDWESFLQKKQLIGYSDLFDWHKKGQKKETLSNVETIIAQKTYQYARRQMIFLRMFKKSLIPMHSHIQMFSFQDGDKFALQKLLDEI